MTLMFMFLYAGVAALCAVPVHQLDSRIRNNLLVIGSALICLGMVAMTGSILTILKTPGAYEYLDITAMSCFILSMGGAFGSLVCSFAKRKTLAIYFGVAWVGFMIIVAYAEFLQLFVPR